MLVHCLEAKHYLNFFFKKGNNKIYDQNLFNKVVKDSFFYIVKIKNRTKKGVLSKFSRVKMFEMNFVTVPGNVRVKSKRLQFCLILCTACIVQEQLQ